MDSCPSVVIDSRAAAGETYARLVHPLVTVLLVECGSEVLDMVELGHSGPPGCAGSCHLHQLPLEKPPEETSWLNKVERTQTAEASTGFDLGSSTFDGLCLK